MVQPLAGKNQVYDNVESIAVAGHDQETIQHAELLNPTPVGKEKATRSVSELSPTLTSMSPA